ncbi:bifunctional oligoribonuclease/PAP phosphatase NrnA [Mycoplasmatota bacterium]|nr:bifunctional oligoribonuclease/PAP phosphatase NrnA [Mycoplasmatota bacterium]
MNIKKEILKTIESYETIIIHRHARPDMDAIGSQVGLSTLLKENYPSKNIYVVGDLNDMSYKATMDNISNEIYDDALAIITDVAVTHMISDERYALAKERIIIDHHTNETNVEDVKIFYRDDSFASACEMIIDLAKSAKYDISSEAATYLYGGMVTDTGRFMFLKEATKTFKLAAYITKFNPNIKDFYNYIYTEPLKKRKVKNMFSHFELTKHNVAYRKNTHQTILDSGLDFQSVSRGMVNQMAGIKEVPIWANFTEDIEKDAIIGEFRARGITIVDIAKKYGGGGHNEACGATLQNWDEVEKILKDLDERAKEHEKNIR